MAELASRTSTVHLQHGCTGTGEPQGGSPAGQQSKSLMSFRELLDAALLDDTALEGMLPPEDSQDHAQQVSLHL